MTDKEEITSLLMKHRKALFAYIYAILHDHHLAEDVFQEVSIVLVQKWNESVEIKNLWPFAREVARRKALGMLRKQKRGKLVFSDQALDAIDEGFDLIQPQTEDRKQYLGECIELLPSNWKKIVRLRYWKKMPVKHLSASLGQSANAVSVTMNRIRARLADCVNLKTGECAS